MSVFSATREIKGLVTSDERQHAAYRSICIRALNDDLKKINYPKESIGVMTAIDGSFIINVPDNITRISSVIWNTIKKRSNSERKIL